MKPAMTISMILVGLLFSPGAVAAQADQLLPVVAGKTWRFSVRIQTGSQVSGGVLLLSTGNPDPRGLYPLTTTLSLPSGTRIFKNSGLRLRSDGVDLLMTKALSTFRVLSVENEPVMDQPAATRLGPAGKRSSITFNITAASTGERVESPVGIFTDTVTYRVSFQTGTAGILSGEGLLTLSRGVGPVKAEFTIPSINSTVRLDLMAVE